MTVPLAHFYHVYAGSDWKNIYDDHYACLEGGGLLGALGKHFYVGLVGSFDQRQDAINYFATKPVSPIVIAQSDIGWEQETIDALYDFSVSCNDEFYISYAHTKGATSGNSGHNVNWRRTMEYVNIYLWKDAVSSLDSGSCMAGCYWMANFKDQLPFFGGNFWWIKSSVAKLLDRSDKSDRFQAETWVSRVIEFIPDAIVTDLFPAIYGSVYTPQEGLIFTPLTRPFMQYRQM